MGLFDKFNQTFGFTKTEKQVVLLLVAAFLLGIGMKILKSGSGSENGFDYTQADSEFQARSRMTSEMDSSDSKSDLTDEKVTSETSGLIDINRASKDQLIELPGIGEAMAERIILYREEHGPFNSVNELASVKGVGGKKLSRIAPYCTVGK